MNSLTSARRGVGALLALGCLVCGFLYSANGLTVARDVSRFAATTPSTYAYDRNPQLSLRADVASPKSPTAINDAPPTGAPVKGRPVAHVGFVIAAKAEGAAFAQTTYREAFSAGGRFGGQTIDDVAGGLRSGALSPKDVPIDLIVRGGNSLILNTRSAQALTRAGIPRSDWMIVNRTGDDFFERLLSGQLSRNGLGNFGTFGPRSTG